jgi:hypothetical protein
MSGGADIGCDFDEQSYEQRNHGLKHLEGLPKSLVKRRPGMKLIQDFGPAEPIVAMVNRHEQILVATALRVFKMTKDDTFEPLRFYEDKNDNPLFCQCETCMAHKETNNDEA